MTSLFDGADRKDRVMKEIRELLSKEDARMTLNVARDLMIDLICLNIDKFPKQKQMEMIAIISNKYLVKFKGG